MPDRLGQHAVVIGGSIAGLMVARVLTDHFDQVTVLDRDHIEAGTAVHKSVPQGNHLHALMLGGQQVLSSLYPGFTDRLQQLGAVRFRFGMEAAFFFPGGRAYTPTGSVREARDLGIDGYSQSRGLLAAWNSIT
jgi:phytoene dehydrogenase-like protein